MGFRIGVCSPLQNQFLMPPTPVSSLHRVGFHNGILYWSSNVGGKDKSFNKERKVNVLGGSLGLDSFHGRFGEVRRKGGLSVVASASSNVAAPFWDSWVPEKGSKAPSLSDIIWPSAGAFAAMAILGKIDQVLVPKGISMTIAPLGAVCAVLFATPSSPGARAIAVRNTEEDKKEFLFAIFKSFNSCGNSSKLDDNLSQSAIRLLRPRLTINMKYNMFMAQIGCAAIGVLAFTIFGPGWLARSSALAAAIAFMTYTRAVHPPAASLPLLFIDGAKLHHLNFWYALFPGAAGCIILCLIQEIVCYLKENLKF